jgi:hypothetical protein
LFPACQKVSEISIVRCPGDEGVNILQLVRDHIAGRQHMSITFESPKSRDEFWSVLEKTLDEPQSLFVYWAELKAHRRCEIASTLPSLDPLLPLISASNFPLSADHRLFVLVQHNTLRGVMANMSILIHLAGRPVEGWANFYTEDLPFPPGADSPLALRHTSFQKCTPHEAWIDVIPYPALRDNIIKD